MNWQLNFKINKIGGSHCQVLTGNSLPSHLSGPGPPMVFFFLHHYSIFIADKFKFKCTGTTSSASAEAWCGPSRHGLKGGLRQVPVGQTSLLGRNSTQPGMVFLFLLEHKLPTAGHFDHLLQRFLLMVFLQMLLHSDQSSWWSPWLSRWQSWLLQRTLPAWE